MDLLQEQHQRDEGTALSSPEVRKVPIVCALQAARLPGRHEGLLPVQVVGGDSPPTSLFVPDVQLIGDSHLQVAEAVVEPDREGRMTILVENHSSEPIFLEKGLVLGALHEMQLTAPDPETVEKLDGQPQTLREESPLIAQVHGSVACHYKELQQLEKAVMVDETNLTPEQQKQIYELVVEYRDVFALHSLELGSTEVVKHVIDTGDSKPIKQPARRVPFVLRQKIEEMTTQMLDAGVIEPSKSPWASPVVLVRKKDGSHRFCIDYRRLNAVTKMDVLPLPRIDDTLDLPSQTKFFTTLDLASGYWQVQMDSGSKEKTAFVTHSGLFEFCVMPFGLCNASSTFQRLMEIVLAGLARECCMVYIDDVLVMGHEFEDHLSNLRKVFERLRSAELKLKPQKCFFRSGRAEYLGYVVSRE
jgi:hypothetical protein